MAKRTRRVVANKCRLELNEFGLEVIELDKDLCEISRIDFSDFANGLIDIDGVSINISYDEEF